MVIGKWALGPSHCRIWCTAIGHAAAMLSSTASMRMVAKADSITLVVRMCVQCAAGKSWKASSFTRSRARQIGRLRVLALVAGDEVLEGVLGLGAGLGHQISCSPCFAFACPDFGR